MQLSKLIILIIFLGCSTASAGTFYNEWVRAGHTKLQQQDYDQAVFYFTRSIEEYPNEVQGYLNRAKVFMLQHKYQEARADYLKALEINPAYLKERVILPKKDSLNRTPPEKELFIN
ncbi:MAG: tetratricopeptide repeat protein [Bacteroidota bacterium]